jgi:hypothetical protein
MRERAGLVEGKKISAHGAHGPPLPPITVTASGKKTSALIPLHFV